MEKSYEQILDDTNQLIQISDCETFSMMYANQPARSFTGHANQDYRGEKCYHYMMGLDEQCPFCPMFQMKDKDSFVAEVDNGVQVFTVKTKRIEWEGKEAFIEYATDVTTLKRAQQIFESQMQRLLQSIPEAQGIFHVNLTTDAWLSSNGISKDVKNLKDMKSVNELFQQISSYIPDQPMQDEFYQNFKREALINAYENGKTEVVMETESYYDDKSIRWTRLTARLIMNPNTGELECIFYGMDINEEKMYRDKVQSVQREKQELLEKSKMDMLTGVYSKTAFEQLVKEYRTNYPEHSFAIIFLDLDHFKNVNDSLGHLMGDKVIIDIAEKLQTIFSNKDIVSRFGGDEFCVLVKDIPADTLLDKLEFLLKSIHHTYESDGIRVEVTASIGASYYQNVDGDVKNMIQQADIALYQAKRNGRNQYQIIYMETKH